jgi:hypothetical protein
VLLCLGLVLASLRQPAVVLADDDRPRIRRRLFASARTAPWPAALLTAVLTGVSAGLVIGPWFGVPMAVVALLALRLPQGRVLPVIGAAGGIALAGAYTAAKELRYGYKADFGWTDTFHPAHLLAWSGLALLALLIAVDGVRADRDEADRDLADRDQADEEAGT